MAGDLRWIQISLHELRLPPETLTMEATDHGSEVEEAYGA